MLVAVLICAYLVLTSLIAYAAFAWDKRCAVRGNRRIPEARLLFWAAIGGWPGAKLAQHKLRHKTYKQPFGRKLNGVALVQVMVVLTGLLLVSMTASNQRVVNAPLLWLPPLMQDVSDVDEV